MKKNVNSPFDKIATSYYDSVPQIPQKYIELVLQTFDIKQENSILDLGCGSGNLAIELAKKTEDVTGIDISKTMIDLAKKNDIEKKVKWIQMPVEHFDFKKEKYDLIISYESFHLFSNKAKLIKDCANALKSGGTLCVGWTMYSFDYLLKDTIKEVFSNHGVSWDDWGAWTCPDFPDLIEESKVSLSKVKKKKIKVKARISTEKIIDYLLSVSKTATIHNKLKTKISHELSDKVMDIYSTGESIGYDEYSIMYCKKI